MEMLLTEATMEELLDRRQQVEERLEEVGVGDAPVAGGKAAAVSPRASPSAAAAGATKKRSTRRRTPTAKAEALDEDHNQKPAVPHEEEAASGPLIPYAPKSIDTHWDFVAKEMMWLGADFQGERKRQISLAKKLASSVKQFHKTKETRRLKELQAAELKRRKLAAKTARGVKGWWHKLEKVIAYKQKVEADKARENAMNKQLVTLVQQTEKYTEALTTQQYYTTVSDEGSDDDDDESDNSETTGSEGWESSEMATTSDSETGDRRKRRRRRRRRRGLTIEEALAAENTSVRSSKKRVIDYSRMRLPTEDDFYGASTASEEDANSATDEASFSPGEDSESDDNSTLHEAIREELRERRNGGVDDEQEDPTTFLADPEELRRLREEATMDLEQVLERLRSAAEAGDDGAEPSPAVSGDPSHEKHEKKVSFADATPPPAPSSSSSDAKAPPAAVAKKPREDPSKYDADDDGDASDVEDYDDTADQKSDEEYEGGEPEVDDETTIAQEESLPREISASDEISLLQQEGEMPIEELRKLYGNLGGPAADDDDDDDEASHPARAQFSRRRNTRASAETEPPATTTDAQEDEAMEDLEEFEPVFEADDETTIEAEERLGRDMTHEEEMEMLKRESEIPIEELRAMYAGQAPQSFGGVGSSETPPFQGTAEESEPSALAELTKFSEAGRDAASGSEEEGGEEFKFDAAEAVDDETTIEAEERLGREMSYQDEIALLKRESEMSVEELRAMYASMHEDSESSPPDQSDEEVEAEDAEEYEPAAGEGIDDESTIEAEERLGREISHEEEMDLLQKESEIPVEELRKMYQQMQGNNGNAETAEESDDTATHQILGNSLTSNLAEQLSASEDDGGEEFEANPADTIDDETTIEAEERLGRDMTYEAEIALLKQESEMSIEDLRKKYLDTMGDDNGDEMQTNIEEAPQIETKRKRLDIENENSVTSNKKQKSESSGDKPEDGLAALNALEASAERAQQTLASRPFLLSSWVKLRKYQQVGLNWLVSLQTRRLNGILADEMGLGKTLQTIALLSYLASYKGIWGPHLIVVPTSVIINWETELKRFCPALKVLCYYGNAKRRKELRQGWTKTNWYHVVITSYQLAVQDAFAFKRKKWYYLVLDEAQNIKNFQSQRWQTLINFNTQRRLLLTGTPLQNNLMELWSLLHFLMPYIFRSRKEFSYWFSNPMNNIIEGNVGRNDDVIKRLHGIIRPFVLRRLKKNVETQMPGKYEHVVKCKLSRRQMTLYEEFLSRSSTRQALQKNGNFMGMMNVLMQLRKVCNHPDLFEPRSVITPFVLPSLSLTIPDCVLSDVKKSKPLEVVSSALLRPIWSGSSGRPSMEAALRHDDIESDQLKRLVVSLPSKEDNSNDLDSTDCPDELKELVTEVNHLRTRQKSEKGLFQNRTNGVRCSASPFPYPSRLLHAVEVERSIFQRSEPVELKEKEVLLTPAQLLQMRRKEVERAMDMEEIIDKFVFCVPPAGAQAPILDCSSSQERAPVRKRLQEMLLEPLEEVMRPYQKAHARLSSFFPDKKLIQFDAGKLQTLAELLRNLKRGGHRALIFTQMSKMLDILEAFLNINGHTYLRLDGATGVDRRQRYMDRFNNDTKIFCFILSTRSGGMGINLTGADTVIFYDSDWNPAMDAQAQDRAHRIGQTRDVHIYRLITEHTIEENILMKANQKKNLDIIVMDQGKFDASHQQKGRISENKAGDENDVKDVFTKGGLRAILGASEENAETTTSGGLEDGKEISNLSKEQMEMAMASLEDEDDVKALRGAQKEAAEEMKEFDENVEIKKDSDAEDEETEVSRPKKKQKKAKQDSEKAGKDQTNESKNEENDLEKEFAAWQTNVGLDASTIESSLSPMEKYGLTFREEIDPFYSIFYINEMRRKSEATEVQEEIDIEEIEREKALEERKAMDDGDLLGTRPRPESLIRQRNLYQRERSRLRSDKKRRYLTGENWSQKVDGLTKNLFWYNADTGEAIWDKPLSLIELEAEEAAKQKGWGYMPVKVLLNIMNFLIPYPERQSCALVCSQWKLACSNIKFVRHVYPVEMSALAKDPSRRDYNHFQSIDEALNMCLPGDTIELSDGHYWVSNGGLLFEKPLKLIGDENNPANVIIEMSGSIRWKAQGGFIEGITFRRPKMTSGDLPDFPMLELSDKGRVDMIHSVFDNDGSTGPVVKASGDGSKGQWRKTVFRNGGSHGLLLSGKNVSLNIKNCAFRGNAACGLHCSQEARFSVQDSYVENNNGYAISVSSGATGELRRNKFLRNRDGVLQRETGCILSCTMNTAVVATQLSRGISGFRIFLEGQPEAVALSSSRKD